VTVALPNAWAYVDFEDAVDVVSDRGIRIKQKNYLSTGPIPVVDQGEGLIGGFTNNADAIVLFAVSAVIVFGDHTRRFKFVKFPFAVGADGVKVFAPRLSWDATFLFLQLGTVDLENRGYGRHYQQLRKEKLLLPPLPEQTRIVEKLEELLSDLDAGVAELKAAQKKLMQYRQSLLKAAVEGALTAEWRAAQQAPLPPGGGGPGGEGATGASNQPPPLPNPSPTRGQGLSNESGAQLLERILKERRARWQAKQLAKFKEQGKASPKDWQDKYPEPVKPNTIDLPPLPEGWVWASLDSLIEEGPQNGVYLRGSLYGSGNPILRIDDFQVGWVRERESLNLVKADAECLATYSLQPHDLIINRVNSVTHLGKSTVAGVALDGVLFESNMMRIRLSSLCAVSYVGQYLGSHIGRMRLIKNAKWAVNQASINQQDVRNTPVPLAPIAEQLQVFQRLQEATSGIDAQTRAILQSISQSTAQRKNILKAAFSGQLVPQDPNDEPAIVLLARIRGERAMLPVKKIGKRANAASSDARANSVDARS
jgi:type I restriction enzyme, S subunit